MYHRLYWPINDGIMHDVCLIALSELGCRDTVCKEFVLEEDHVMYIPTAFTPNGDHLNDEFAPVIKQVLKYEMRIFNRWGDEVWYTDNPSDSWNGMHNGSLVPMGVYIWTIELQDMDGISKKKKGRLLISPN